MLLYLSYVPYREPSPKIQQTQNYYTKKGDGMDNRGFNGDLISNYDSPTNNKSTNPYLGAQVVRTPKEAIDLSVTPEAERKGEIGNSHYQDANIEEDTYVDIDDIDELRRPVEEPSRADIPVALAATMRHVNTSPMPYEENPYDQTADGAPTKQYLETRKSSGVDKVKINNEVYYSPFMTQAKETARVSNSVETNSDMYYNSNEDLNSDDNDPNEEVNQKYYDLKLTKQDSGHSYQRVSPSPGHEGGFQLDDRYTRYIHQTDEEDTYYSTVADAVTVDQRAAQVNDPNIYNDVDL